MAQEHGYGRHDPGQHFAADQQGLAEFAHEWLGLVFGTSFVSMTRREIEHFLLGRSELLAAALLAEPFSALPAAVIGESLVETGFTGPTVLDRTLRLVGNTFLGALGLEPGGELAQRIVALMGSLAAGYADALRERTFDEQETIKLAMFNARKTAEQELRASDARFRAVFAASAIGIAVSDSAGRILDANPSLLTILGCPSAQLVGRTIAELAHPDDQAALSRSYGELSAGRLESFNAEKRFVRGDDDLVWAQLAVSVVRDPAGSTDYQIAMVENVTDRYLLHQRLQHQALHDPLTGLANRSLFTTTLEGALGRKDPGNVALCLLDIDGFKVINDGLGPRFADALLRTVADRLLSTVDEGMGLVAYLGGDQFAIILTRTAGTAEVAALVERILGQLAEPVQLFGHRLAVSASAGIVERQRSGTEPADLIRDANITLRWAKEDGRAQWTLFDPERNTRDRARFQMAAGMPTALENGEFYLEYQPIVRLRDDAVRGVEALLRWNHPELGVLGPPDFLELAEQIGLSVPLGRWAMREACAQASRWQTALGQQAPAVSINLAQRQLHDPDLIRDLRSILQDTGVQPKQLWVELSERAVPPQAAEVLDTVGILSEMGVQLVIDDFGADPADPAHLRDLPLHAVKVASAPLRGLVPGADADPAHERIVSDLIALAHVLRLPVIVDGVTTTAQAKRLRELGCDAGQGKFFGAAGTPEAVRTMLIPSAAR